MTGVKLNLLLHCNTWKHLCATELIMLNRITSVETI